jgi:hypothetical protein
MMIPSPVKDSLYGFLGTAAPIVAVVTSYQEQVEYNFRIASMVIGMLASLAYCWSILRKRK